MIKVSRKMVAIVIAVALVIVFLLNSGVVSLESYHTGIPEYMINNGQTVHEWEDVWEGQGYPEYREMFADDKYVTAYNSGGVEVLSERINFWGNIWEDSIVEIHIPLKGYYKVDIKTGLNDPWVNIIDDNFVDTTKVQVNQGVFHQEDYYYNPIGLYGQRVDLSPAEIQLKGPFVGAIRVEQHTLWRGLNPWDTWWNVISIDYAYLISGAGSINIVGYDPGDVPMFEILENVPINVEADYSGSTSGGTGYWSLWYYPQSGDEGGMITSWNYDWIRTVYNWELPQGIWYRGISDSKVDIVLKNSLFDVDEVMINTIDLRANAPPTPTISLSNYDPMLGEDLDIWGSCHTNENTHEEIQNFHIKAQYSDNWEQIGYWTNVPAVGQDPSTYAFTIPGEGLYRAGPIRVQVWGHDIAGRESENPGIANGEVHFGTHRWTITVKSEGTSLPLSGVSVTINPGNVEKFTGANGVVWFDIDTGYYQASLYKAGYRHEVIDEQISGDTSTTVYLEQTAILWDLTVNVEDTDANRIPYATINIGGVSEAYSDESGSWTFTNIPEGDYLVSVHKNDYSGTKDVHLDGPKTVTVTIYEGGDDGALDLVKVAVSVLILALFGVIGFFFGDKLPLPFKGLNKFIIILIGVVIAIVYYIML